tara:strand:- start:7743 stop:7886 length:144 start_codon:yes stop_codon:yes gene_type:complete
MIHPPAIISSKVNVTSIDNEKKRVFFGTVCSVKNKVKIDGKAELFIP